MHQWSKSRVKLNYDIRPLEANWIGDLVAVNTDANNCRVNQTYFYVGIIGFVRDRLTSLLTCTLLYALNNQRHFLFGQRFVTTLAAIAYGAGVAFNQLARNTDHGQLARGSRHFFGLT